MDSNKISSWIQITATVGVMIGIALVIVELRQAKAMARAETVSQFFSEVAQSGRVQMGENSAPILSKACLQPTEITQVEIPVLEGYFIAHWALADRSYRLEMAADFDTPWEEISGKVLQSIVRLEHGRKWISKKATTLNPKFRKLISEMLEEVKNASCADYYSEIYGATILQAPVE